MLSCGNAATGMLPLLFTNLSLPPCASACCREGGFGDGPSRADEADDWGKTKAFVPSSSRGGFEERRGGFGDRREGGGFRDRSPGAYREPSRADTEDRWSR